MLSIYTSNANSQMTEEQWRFFVDEWNRYKRQTKVKDQELLDELWSCMVEELRHLAFAEGGSGNLLTEEIMTKKIKSLAVVSLHSSVHVVNLHEQRQQSDETVHSFAARVRSQMVPHMLTPHLVTKVRPSLGTSLKWIRPNGI